MIFPSRTGNPVAYPAFAFAPLEAGIDAATAHSWRSIWRDFAGDVARIDRDLAEAQLAHALGPIEASYRQQSAIEARRGPLELYARWLTGDAGAEVIAFPTMRA